MRRAHCLSPVPTQALAIPAPESRITSTGSGVRAEKAYQTLPAMVVWPEFPARDDGLDKACCTHAQSVNGASPAQPCAQQAEAEVVVAIARRVVVAIRRTAVRGGVVPVAATIHPVRACFGCHPKLTPNLMTRQRTFGAPPKCRRAADGRSYLRPTAPTLLRLSHRSERPLRAGGLHAETSPTS